MHVLQVETPMKAEESDRTTMPFDSETVMELLHFIYREKISGDLSDLNPHFLLDAACTYAIEGLKSDMERRLIEEKLFHDSLALLVLADRYDLPILKNMILNDVAASEQLTKYRNSESAKLVNEDLWSEVTQIVDASISVSKFAGSVKLFPEQNI